MSLEFNLWGSNLLYSILEIHLRCSFKWVDHKDFLQGSKNCTSNFNNLFRN